MEGKIHKGKILVKVLDAAKMTKGGIIVPNAVSTRQKEAEVVIGGEETACGDNIYFVKDGVELSIDNEKYLLLNERDVCFIK